MTHLDSIGRDLEEFGRAIATRKKVGLEFRTRLSLVLNGLSRRFAKHPMLKQIVDDLHGVPFVAFCAGPPERELPRDTSMDVSADVRRGLELLEELQQTLRLVATWPPDYWRWRPTRTTAQGATSKDSFKDQFEDFLRLRRECVRVSALLASPTTDQMFPEELHRMVVRCFRENLAPRVLLAVEDERAEFREGFMKTAVAKAYFARPPETGPIARQTLLKRLDEVIEFLEAAQKGRLPRSLSPTSQDRSAKQIIDAYRNKKGLTMEVLAHRLGVSVTVLYRLKKGELRASAEKLEKIANRLGCSPGELHRS